MTIDLEFLKDVLGVLSILGATVSGVAALLVEFKNKETGEITKWGRYAIFGLAASFLIGTSNIWIDYTQKSHNAQEAAKRSREDSEKTLQIVTDISRTLHPLKDVRFDFWLTYRFDDPDLVKYRQRLDKEVRALLPSLMKYNEKPMEGIRAVDWSDDGTIDSVYFGENSSLFPNEAKENFAYLILSNIFLQFYFYKSSIDPATLDPESSLPPTADISMSVESHSDSNHLLVVYGLKTKTIGLHGQGIPSYPKYWHSSGAIVSVLDLPGSQIIIDANQTFFASARVKPEIGNIVLNIAERRGWWLRKDKIKLYKTKSGPPFYMYTFPNTYQELTRLDETD